MHMAICTMPGCQTSAGCKCNPPVYLAPFTPSPADEWYGKELAALNAEIERLRLSLSEARATGRREGLSEAAEIADEHAAEDKLEAKILREIKDYARAKQLDCGSESCQRLAAAIRAAMEKAE